MNHSEVSAEIRLAAERLIREAGRGTLLEISPMSGGRNNRVYRVVGQQGTAVLKNYHRSPPPERDRYYSELAWYRYCQSQQIRQVPEFCGADPESSCLLLSEIAGRKLVPNEVTANHVRQAAEFLIDLNRGRSTDQAIALPAAADACFTIQDYLDHVDTRLERLQQLQDTDDLLRELKLWLSRSLIPTWRDIRNNVESHFSNREIVTERSSSERWISPSDFGFHNALQDHSDRLSFLDFEYAGWDDPAKTVCDFFWQVDIPAPRSALPEFLETARAISGDIQKRVRYLFPVIGTKWVTIVLNEFLSDGRDRRDFAAGSAVSFDKRAMQLEVGKSVLSRVIESMQKEIV